MSMIRCHKCNKICGDSKLPQKELDERLKLLPVFCSICCSVEGSQK